MEYNKIKKLILIASIFICILEAKETIQTGSDNTIVWTIPEKKLPLPSAASIEIQHMLSQSRQPNIAARKQFSQKTKKEWNGIISYSRESGEEGAKEWAEKFDVSIKQDTIDGINIYRLTPSSISPINKNRLFVYLHGGAYIFGGGMSGLHEGILIANRAKIPVIAIDYRMPPDHPYPIAIEDVVRVYKSLIQSKPAKSIAMGGSSSGGGLTLAVIQKLKSLHLDLPGALFAGTPWSDLSKTGDSLYVNEGIDRKIVTYDGLITAAADLYANGHDLKESGLSPVYGDFSKFPPTMFVTGTRDLFLSMTVRVHRKMRASGVQADLNVYEGLSHVDYFVVPDAPESKEAYRELGRFLKQHLK